MNLIIDPKIIQLLEKELIKPKGGLAQVYERLQNYHEASKKTEDEKTLYDKIKPILRKNDLQGSFKSLISKEMKTMSIDFPMKFSKDGTNRKTIMVCAMDPLPPNSQDLFWNYFLKKDHLEDEIKKKIVPWAPFSLIDDWEEGMKKGKRKNNFLFFNTLFDEFDIYVTDVYKFFYRRPGYKDKRSNGEKLFRELSRDSHKCKAENIHGYILSKEIETVEPSAIVTLGNKSRDALLRFIKETAGNWGKDVKTFEWIDKKTKIISIPHISGAANGAKTDILGNMNYKNLYGTNTERLAKIVIENIKRIN